MKRKNCKNSGKRWKAKRVLTLCMTALLLVSSVGSAYAAEKQVNATNSVVAEASSMRLQKKEGTVILTNKEGKPLSAMNNMRIYDGYKIGTEQKSYGWIALDDTKLVKEDAASSLRVQQDGKKLDVYLESGSLFFNISKPLEQDETFTVHTSTMAMGCRGTSGQIQVIDPKHTQIVLTDGTVVCETSEQAEGGARVETITAGSVADIYIGDVLKEGETKKEQATVTIRKATVEDLRGFSATEILGDQQLQERVAKGSGLDLSSLNEYAPARLQKDEKIVWEDSSYSSDDSSDSSGVTNESTEEKTEEEEDLTSTTLPASATVAEIQAALDKFETVNIQNDGSATAVMIDSALDVAEGKTLNIDPALPVNVTGNSTNLTVDGTLTAGTINNGGTINNNSANSIHVKGEFINQGTFHNGENGVLYFEGSSTVLKNSGSVEMAGGEIKGSIDNTGNVDLNGGKISGNFDNTGYVKMSGGQINGNVKHTGARGSLGLNGGVIVGNITAPGGILSMGDVELQGSLNLNGKFLGLTSCVITGNINVTDAELTIAENAYIKGQITLNSGKLEMYGGTVDNGDSKAIIVSKGAACYVEGGVIVGGITSKYGYALMEERGDGWTEPIKINLLENKAALVSVSESNLNSLISGGQVFVNEQEWYIRSEELEKTYEDMPAVPEKYVIYQKVTYNGSQTGYSLLDSRNEAWGNLTGSDKITDNLVIGLLDSLNYYNTPNYGSVWYIKGKTQLNLNGYTLNMNQDQIYISGCLDIQGEGCLESRAAIDVWSGLRINNSKIALSESGKINMMEVTSVSTQSLDDPDDEELVNDLEGRSVAAGISIEKLDDIQGLVLNKATITGEYVKSADGCICINDGKNLPNITVDRDSKIINKIGSPLYWNPDRALTMEERLNLQKTLLEKFAEDQLVAAEGMPKIAPQLDANNTSAFAMFTLFDEEESNVPEGTQEPEENQTKPETQVGQGAETPTDGTVVPSTDGDTPDPEDLNETDNPQNPTQPEETIVPDPTEEPPVQPTAPQNPEETNEDETPQNPPVKEGAGEENGDPESTEPPVTPEPTEETPTPNEETPDPENNGSSNEGN